MTTRLVATRLVAARHAVIAGLALSAVFAGSSFAQDSGASDEPAPARPDADAQRAQRLMGRLVALHAIASERPTTAAILAAAGDSEAQSKARAEFAVKKREWEESLKAIPSLADDYLAAAGASPDPNAWFFAGQARAMGATIAAKSDVQALLEGAVRDLDLYLSSVPADSSYVADAQRHLAYALIRTDEGDGVALSKAITHANVGVRTYLANGQSAEAGQLAFLILNSLLAADRAGDAQKLTASWDVEKADLGPSTEGVRALSRRARIRPGESFPKLPEVASHDGSPIVWSSLAGKPFILHFFSTVVSTPTREIETILLPLKERYGAAGLALVGCSTDREMDDEELARTKANWEEWGKTDMLRDGRLDSVRDWAERRDVDWPWYWDGKWMKNTLVVATGARVSGPYAVLVDKEGKIVWCGAPFDGLREAVDALMAPR